MSQADDTIDYKMRLQLRAADTYKGFESLEKSLCSYTFNLYG